MTTPLFEVDEPPFEVAGYGLYSAAPPLDPDAAEAQSGVWWEPTVCGVPDSFPIGCPQPDVFPLDVPEGLPLVEARPFGVSARVQCKPVGTSLERLREVARTRLKLAEQHAVELVYWTGVAQTGGALPATVPRLADPAATVLSGTALKAALAFGRLEEAIGNMTGAVGVIHAPRVAFPALKGMVSESRGVMRTELGTKVVFGTGYPGTGPAGQVRADESTWLFATGPVQVVRGPVIDLPGRLSDALDRETNVATVQAARIVSVAHECGLVAVPVNLTA